MVTVLFGKKTGAYSVFISFVFAGFDWFFQFMPDLTGNLSSYPMAAALLGGALLGIGEGLLLRQNISSGIDSSVALAVEKRFKISPSLWFNVTDTIILLLSYLYVPEINIIHTLLAVFMANAVLALFEHEYGFAIIPWRRGAIAIGYEFSALAEKTESFSRGWKDRFEATEAAFAEKSRVEIREPITDNLP